MDNINYVQWMDSFINYSMKISTMTLIFHLSRALQFIVFLRHALKGGREEKEFKTSFSLARQPPLGVETT